MNNYSMKYLIEGLIGYKARAIAEPRKEIWASDLGKPYIDIYLSMKGVVPTNPADAKGLMTFFLGKEIENGIGALLNMCGIAYEGQEKVTIEIPNCLPVVGRPDFIVEVTDWDEIRKKMKKEFDVKVKEAETKHIDRITDQARVYNEALDNFESRYPKGLPKTVFECKSINTQALKWAKQVGLRKKYFNHVLQLYTYLIGLKLQEGHIIYISKDYGEIEEVVVNRTKEMDEKWLEEIKTISRYYLDDIEPELPLNKGMPDWRINYSKYKDLLLEKLEKNPNKFDGNIEYVE